jgi:hypothetical protein
MGGLVTVGGEAAHQKIPPRRSTAWLGISDVPALGAIGGLAAHRGHHVETAAADDSAARQLDQPLPFHLVMGGRRGGHVVAPNTFDSMFLVGGYLARNR